MNRQSSHPVQSFPRLRRWAAVAALAAASAVHGAPPEYSASVRQSYVKRLDRVALAPMSCPQDIDCKEIEEALTESFTDAGARVVASQAVQDLMKRAGVGDLDQFEHRLILAEGLRVDGFVRVTIRDVSIDTSAPAADDKWREYKRSVTVKNAAADLQIIARDGAVLADVSGEAHVVGMKGLQGVVVELLDVMLERARQRAD